MKIEQSVPPLPVFSLLQEAVLMYVRHAPRLLGITALLQLPLILFDISLRLGITIPELQQMRQLGSGLERGLESPAAVIDSLGRAAMGYFGGALILYLVQSLLLQPLLACVLTNAAQQVIKGQRLTIRGAYQLPIGTYKNTLVANGVLYALTVLPVALIIGSMLWFLWRAQTALSSIDSSQAWNIVIVLLIAVFPTLLICIYLTVRLQLTPQAIVFDRMHTFQGIKQTWHVTSAVFWRLLGAMFLMGVLMSTITGFPDTLAYMLVAIATVGSPSSLVIAQIVAAGISGIGYGVWMSLQIVLYTFFYNHLRTYHSHEDI